MKGGLEDHVLDVSVAKVHICLIRPLQMVEDFIRSPACFRRCVFVCVLVQRKRPALGSLYCYLQSIIHAFETTSTFLSHIFKVLMTLSLTSFERTLLAVQGT